MRERQLPNLGNAVHAVHALHAVHAVRPVRKGVPSAISRVLHPHLQPPYPMQSRWRPTTRCGHHTRTVPAPRGFSFQGKRPRPPSSGAQACAGAPRDRPLCTARTTETRPAPRDTPRQPNARGLVPRGVTASGARSPRVGAYPPCTARTAQAAFSPLLVLGLGLAQILRSVITTELCV